MKEKYCNKCKKSKPIGEFHKRKDTKDGLQTQCKDCRNSQNRDYSKLEEIRVRRNKYSNEYKKRPHVKEKIINARNSQQHKDWYDDYYKRPEVISRIKDYHSDPLNKVRRNFIRKNRLKNDPVEKLQKTIRDSIRRSLKKGSWQKNNPTKDIIGCSFEMFKKHIERQFTKGMTWNNHGQGEDTWQLDHITPISYANTKEEVYELNHYTNFQPLWSEDNNFKRAKLPINYQIKLTL